MIFGIVIGVLFLAIVFFHYLQGFFGATISAVIAIFSAVLSLSLHEQIVESYMKGKAVDIAHGMVLVGLFAVIYTLLRTIFDKAVPGNVRLPSAVEKVGGAIMGCVAATFCLGTFVIASEELPFGAAVLGYTTYGTSDVNAQVFDGAHTRDGFNYNELTSTQAGEFNPQDRAHMFPWVGAGVDEIVANLTAHLSDGGSLSKRPMSSVHPDFISELYGQRAGIQAGASHVATLLPNEPEPSVEIDDVYTLPDLARGVRKVDHIVPTVHRRGTPVIRGEVQLPHLMHKGRDGAKDTPVEYIKLGPDPNDPQAKRIWLIVRVSFGINAADQADAVVRITPGAVRLVADRIDSSGQYRSDDYYPVGFLEKGGDGPVLLACMMDDMLFISNNKIDGKRSGADFAFIVDKDGVFEPGTNTIKQGVFVEVKRNFRVDLSGRAVTTTRPAHAIPNSDVWSSNVMAETGRDLNEPDASMPAVASPPAGGSSTPAH